MATIGTTVKTVAIEARHWGSEKQASKQQQQQQQKKVRTP
jgi:hypothetical protein